MITIKSKLIRNFIPMFTATILASTPMNIMASESSGFDTNNIQAYVPVVGEVCKTDPSTNQDLYEYYIERGHDITLDSYKTLRPQVQYRSAESRDKFIEESGIIPTYEEDPSLYTDKDTINWDTTMTRGQYARMINKFIDFYQIPDQPCCMGDSPDFSETAKTDEYYDDIVKAAYWGFYCTRDGSDTTKPFLERELIKYLNKITSDLSLLTIGNNIYTKDMNYNALLSTNYCIDAEPDNVKDTLANLSTYNMLPLDSFGRVNLDRNLTLRELTNVLVGVGDMVVIYQSPEVKTAGCTDCILYNVDKLYETYVPPVKKTNETDGVTETTTVEIK